MQHWAENWVDCDLFTSFCGHSLCHPLLIKDREQPRIGISQEFTRADKKHKKIIEANFYLNFFYISQSFHDKKKIPPRFQPMPDVFDLKRWCFYFAQFLVFFFWGPNGSWLKFICHRVVQVLRFLQFPYDKYFFCLPRWVLSRAISTS